MATYTCKFRNKNPITIDVSISSVQGSVDLTIPPNEVAIIFLEGGDFQVTVFNDDTGKQLFSKQITVDSDAEWLVLSDKLTPQP